jgi:acyl-CoA thioester hydrolase
MTRTRTLEDFPVIIELPVLWGDMDAFGHVNNTRFFRYFESARIAYIERLGLREVMETTGVGPILAETSCKYITPLTYPDTISIGCLTRELNDSEVYQEYLIQSHKTQKTAALGTGKIVAFDFNALERAVFPMDIKRRILEMEPGLS